ncbi:putative histone-lysine N-methyltransferase prdm6 [Porites harrisoni]
MMASTIETQAPSRPSFISSKVKPQSDGKHPRYFAFTEKDLYNCLHQKSGNVEPIDSEEARGKKLEDNSLRKDTRSSFCRTCNKVYAICCPIHPSYKSTDSDFNLDWDSYAIKSFPDVVQLCKSSVPGKTYGVCARQHIPVGTWIGPYEGRRVAPDAIKPDMDSDYLWEIYKDGRLMYYLDATDEESSSWMRFIKCARHRNEQNLFAFQYCGNIYYRAFKEIPIGTELLVWYEDIYPQYFGIPISIHDLNSMGSRSYPVVEASYQDGQKVSSMTTPISVTATEATQHTSAPSHRKSPHHAPVSPKQRSRLSPGLTEREIYARKQTQQETTFKRKHEENDSTGIPKKFKSQQSSKNMTDGHKEMLLQLEEARLKDKKDLPCEWPRVADGEFILENGEPKIWHCGQCDKSFAQRGLLQMHSCSKNTKRPYQCGHCAQEFAHPNELRTHAVIHSGKKPFKCGFCARTFAGATTLNNHVRTHTGERPFSCNKCHRSFSQASQLSKHKRSLYDCFA